ncbi:MAG: MerR family transcriptional regulator, partial [Myxococcota bacterium]
MKRGEQWKVGELARATGTSVRTLHYYEEVGLLTPRRLASGHRVYGLDQIQRLQQILSLRQIGLSLDQIRELLDRRETSPRDIIRRHLDHLRDEISEKQALCDQLQRLADHLDRYQPIEPDDLIETVRYINMFEKYYDKEQIETLEARRRELGEETLRQV